MRFKGTREYCLLQDPQDLRGDLVHVHPLLLSLADGGCDVVCCVVVALMQECKEIQESLPFVATDALDDFAYKKAGGVLSR